MFCTSSKDVVIGVVVSALSLLTIVEPGNAGDMELTPTVHCLGIRIKDVGADITGAGVQYRKVGENDWKEGLPLVVCLGNKYADEDGGEEHQASWEDSAPIIRRLHGSIFWLAPETQYEVQATLTDAAGKAKGTVSGQVKTLPDNPWLVYGKGRTLKVGLPAPRRAGGCERAVQDDFGRDKGG